MDRHANFQNFQSAFMTLLRCATGENWNQIMFECSKANSILYPCRADESFENIVAEGRDPMSWDGTQGCGDDLSAISFHLVFQIVITQIFVNLFIAIIIDAFMGVSETYTLPVSQLAVQDF